MPALKPTVVMTFGRFNPPTKGHEKLFKTIMAIAAKENASPVVFASSSQDKLKNPLSHAEKTAVIRSVMPTLTIGPASAKTILNALDWLSSQGVTMVHVYVGEDRIGEFKKLTASWQKFNEKTSKLKVDVKGLPRSGAMDAKLVSGTAARKHAMAGDLTKLKEVLISGLSDAVVQKIASLIKTRLKTLKEHLEGSYTMFAENPFGMWRALAEMDENEEDDFLQDAELASDASGTEEPYSMLAIHPRESLAHRLAYRMAMKRDEDTTK